MMLAVVGAFAIILMSGARIQPTEEPVPQTPIAVTSPVPVAPVIPAPPKPVPAGPNVYTNPQYGFSIGFPDGWKNDGTGYVYPSITYWNPNKSASIRVWIGGAYPGVAAPEALRLYTESKIARLKLDLPDFAIESQGATTINDMRAWKIIGTWTDANGNADKTEIIAVFYGERIYELTATSFASTFSSYQHDMEAAMGSFVFID